MRSDRDDWKEIAKRGEQRRRTETGDNDEGDKERRERKRAGGRHTACVGKVHACARLPVYTRCTPSCTLVSSFTPPPTLGLIPAESECPLCETPLLLIARERSVRYARGARRRDSALRFRETSRNRASSSHTVSIVR